MKLKLSIYPDEGLLYATYSGKFLLADSERIFLQIIEAGKRHKVQKVLVDGRAVTGSLQTLERFCYGAFVAEKAFELSCHAKFAYVLKEPVLDPERFGETVAINRGMFVKAFDNIKDAEQWLGTNLDNKSIALDDAIKN
ncbi:MAG: hypothetical protein WA584_13080 [Pyrinomonadaceae bacterium]